jgi:hypothetical protein
LCGLSNDRIGTGELANERLDDLGSLGNAEGGVAVAESEDLGDDVDDERNRLRWIVRHVLQDEEEWAEEVELTIDDPADAETWLGRQDVDSGATSKLSLPGLLEAERRELGA